MSFEIEGETMTTFQARVLDLGRFRGRLDQVVLLGGLYDLVVETLNTIMANDVSVKEKRELYDAMIEKLSQLAGGNISNTEEAYRVKISNQLKSLEENINLGKPLVITR